ncbi:MAG: alpha/beta hydrolase [Erythrobacter sp.]
MKRIAALCAVIQLVFGAGPILAQVPADYSDRGTGNLRTVTTESWVEEWDPNTRQWVKVEGGGVDQREGQVAPLAIPTVTSTFVNGQLVSESRSAARYARPEIRRGSPTMLAQYGPFVVTSATNASMIGATNSASPAHFDAMLRDFPQLAMLTMVEAPGTSNDIANLAVGRRIREAGISTHVPNGGSVRSGAVELFLAGATQTIEHGAQFAVHSWLDNHGREAEDFAADHPAHRLYLDYYVEMGMSEGRARDFYAMTNSVPHSSALWLGASDMRPWLTPGRSGYGGHLPKAKGPIETPRIAVASDTSVPLTVGIEPRFIPTVQMESAQSDALPLIPAIHYSDLSATNLARLDV